MGTTLGLMDFAALSPLLVILFAALMLLCIESFAETLSKSVSVWVTLFAFIVALYAAVVSPVSENAMLTPWIRFDSLSRLFTVFFVSIGIGSTLLAATFFQRFVASQGEYYFLLLSSVFGLILVGAAADFLTLFLGLETLSIALYVMCGYMKKWGLSHEAAIKYFLTGSLAAGLLLYGFALIYGAIGTTGLSGMLTLYKNLTTTTDKTLFLSGIGLVTLGLAFKAAIVPFHVWAPDVYEGAPTPVTAFMSVGTKTGAFGAFVVVFLVALPQFNLVWNEGMSLLAYPTLIYANFVALRQTQLRRFFAYSGISHSGFLLIPLAVGTAEAIPALVFYLVVYAFATLGSFAVMSVLDQRSQGVVIHDLHGLFKRSPLLALILALCLLTLAGIPPTIGFVAKFYLFKLAFQAEYYALVVVGLLTTILSAYYYLRIVSVMFSESPAEAKELHVSFPALLVGCVSLVMIVGLSIYPEPLLAFLAK